MPFAYPVFLELAGRRAVVIGETAVREGKVEGLLAADVGDVAVVATRPVARLESLAALDDRVTIERRAWRASDLDDKFVCVASSDDPAERSAIAREARDRGVLVNIMDDIPNCDWAAPSIVRRGELVLAISTGGASPALTKKLRLQLSAMFGEEWAEVLRVLRDVREAAMPFLPDIGDRASRWAVALDTAEAVSLIREGRADDLRERLVGRLLDDTAGRARGIVYLVGAGPGDPKLITIRGAEVLGLADVVVYDRLASPALLDLAPRGAERIYVGKEPGRSATPQHEIDALLVEHALRGRSVVRLKGGDPFVFGRGGEEALALSAAGLPFEVVPGVSSAVAAPALAGIPVTHRGMASGFVVVSGHAEEAYRPILESLAPQCATVVVLMGLGRIEAIARLLLTRGWNPSTPAAVLLSAATADAVTLVTTLAELERGVEETQTRLPGTVVIGEVVRLRAALSAEDRDADDASALSV